MRFFPAADERRRVVAVDALFAADGDVVGDGSVAVDATVLHVAVPAVTSLWTWTVRCWPIRQARSVAWFSTAGFHQRS